MKILFGLFLGLTLLFAQKLQKPIFVFEASGQVQDLIVSGSKLYLACDNGYVDVFDLTTKKALTHIHLPKIKDFMGDAIESKVFSIDIFNGKLLIMSQDSGGYSRMHLYYDKKLHEVLNKESHYNIVTAKYIDANKILLGLLSSDIILYDIKKQKEIWDKQVSLSKFSDFALDEKKKRVAVVDESGMLHIVSTKDGKVLNEIEGINVDNVFSVDFKNDIVLTGGQDRRVGVYDLKNEKYSYITADFFVYGVGLSPSAKIGAFSFDVANSVKLFDVASKNILSKYATTKDIVNGIYFLDERNFFIYSNNSHVGLYRR